eukprot:g944.t1
MLVKSSHILTLGSTLPDFSLVDVVSNEKITPTEILEKYPKGIVIAFLCNHCPFVVNIEKVLAKVTAKFMKAGVGVVGISSNDAATYPQDGPEKMKEKVIEAEYKFPYCYDETQQVALSFGASPTPDFFLFNEKLELKYNGRFCASMPKREKDKTRSYYPSPETTGDDLSNAVELMLAGKSIPFEKQQPSMGCNVKWKNGLEPEYFKNRSLFVSMEKK